MKVRRYAGFCQTAGCSQYGRAAFVLGERAVWHCPRCLKRGHLAEERCWVEGDPGKIVTSCRLSFKFDRAKRQYRHVAVVDDLASPVGRCLVAESPIVRSEQAALALAERLLGAVQVNEVGPEAQPFPDSTFVTLDLSAPREVFEGELRAWERGMRVSGLRVSS